MQAKGFDQVTGFDADTLNFYNDRAETYAASGPGGTSRFLPGFLEKVKPGAKVLDLGCGGGTDSMAMIAAGLSVTPADGSPQIAAKAEARLGVPVKVMRFDELSAEQAFDAIWASASLLHVRREHLADILTGVWRALRPGGLFFASYKSGGTEGRDSHGRYFNYLSKAQALTAYAASGHWQIEEVSEYTGGGFEGGSGPWIALFARRPA